MPDTDEKILIRTGMKKLIAFLKQWTLPTAIVVGILLYLIFAKIEPLVPVGDYLGPKIEGSLPYLIFIILYVSFCKIKLKEMIPHMWQVWLMLIWLVLCLIFVAGIMLTDDFDTKLIFEGLLMCVLCPTASAAPVITEKLGGSMGEITTFIIVANIATSVFAPLFFPLIHDMPDASFLTSFLIILQRVFNVLIMPLFLAFLSRRIFPKFVEKLNSIRNLAFYIWGLNLSIITGVTVRNILNSTDLSTYALFMLMFLPLILTLFLFFTGKAVGSRYNDRVTAGQALGQKNTIVGIWLTTVFLNPLAAVAPGAYVIWQNTFNAWQLWREGKKQKK